MKLTTLRDGSVLTTWDNDRGYLDCAHYARMRNRVCIVTEGGMLQPAFGGLRLLPREPLEQAVLRGLAGARGSAGINWPRVARMIIMGAVMLFVAVAFHQYYFE